jgi:type IV secretory pathway VirB4 component
MSRTQIMTENRLLTQLSFGSRWAANPTPTTKTISSRVPRWKRKRLMSWSPNNLSDSILPIRFQKNDSLFLEGSSQTR